MSIVRTLGKSNTVNQQNPFPAMTRSRELKYCPRCSYGLIETVPAMEDRPRLFCTACGYIFYQIPTIVPGVIPVLDQRVVMLRRGIEPRYGAWTFPSGFMELGETVEEAAVREAKEETNLDVAILSLLGIYSRVEAGTVAAEYQDRVMRNLTCRRLQVDELWTFNYCKQRNVTSEIASKVPGAGSVWLWVAIDADTKLVPCAMVGSRSAGEAHAFIADLASRLRYRVQMTTDKYRPYLQAVESAFGAQVDYAQLVKLYGEDTSDERRYSPAQCIGTIPRAITGNPDPEHISTSFVERQNWTVRTTMRRYTRLSNGFSRKIENHMAAVALNYFAYNFIKVHSTLRTSPAMAAGITDRLFDVSDLVALLVESEREKAA